LDCNITSIDTALYEEIRTDSDTDWLILFGGKNDGWTIRAIYIYEELLAKLDNYPDLKLGFIDISTHEGELMKASFFLYYTPYTFFISSKIGDTVNEPNRYYGQRNAYLLNGLESMNRLT